MSSEQAREYEQRGINAAKAGRKDEARKFLQQSLRVNPESDTAWLWLASVTDGKRERLIFLQKVLEINPNNEMALKAVSAFGIDPQRLIARNQRTEPDAPPPPAVTSQPSQNEPPPVVKKRPPRRLSESPEATPAARTAAAAGRERSAASDMVFERDGVPIPSAERIEAIQEDVDDMLEDMLLSEEMLPLTWVHKTGRRAGEREVWALRLQVAVTLVVFFGVVGGIFAFVYDRTPALQVVFEGVPTNTPTPSPTPTNTPTNTPGFTPTPSPTRDFTQEPTFTPSPTILPTITPGQIEITPRPTALNLPRVPIVPQVREADILINQGNAPTALPLLATARAQQGSVFDPNPYYYEAIAHLETNNVPAAQAILDEAQTLIDNLQGVRDDDVPRFSSLINLGRAQVALYQAEQAAIDNNISTMRGFTDQATALAEDVLVIDPVNANAYNVLTSAASLNGNYDRVIELVDAAQDSPELFSDLNLILAKGQAYLQRGRIAENNGNLDAARSNYANATFEADYALLLNPYSTAAHELQVAIALAQDDPGLAVIRSQGYLLYYPQSIRGFQLLGDARIREGNTDLALQAYNRALESVTEETPDSVVAAVLVSRAELYALQRRDDLALADLNAALEREDSLATRAARMQIAYTLGEFEVAQEDAALLLSNDQGNTDLARLIQARILVDNATNDDDYNQALQLLTAINRDNLDTLTLADVDDYLAQIYFALDSQGDALNAINRALAVVETGSRHYLRGQIFEAQEEPLNAILEYEWVLTWDRVYDYPFAEDARQRIQRIQARLAATPTPTATP